MSRWTYKNEKVKAGDNSQEVRQLTAEQRRLLFVMSKDGEASAIPQQVVQWGAVNPPLSEKEVADMPPDLLDACSAAIIRLTGIDSADEKKETTDSAPTS